MESLQLSHLSGEAAETRYNLPPHRDLFATRPIDVHRGDAAETMEAIRQAFHNTYELYEKVYECLASSEAFTVPPIHRLRHPLIFYYGHTACFYINKLVTAGVGARINPAYEESFAIGVDEMSWDDLNDKHYDWPSVAAVSAYRLQVRDAIDALMTSGKYKLRLPLTFATSTANADNAFWWVMLMGIEHEHIHLETASVHVRELPLKYVDANMNRFWRHCCQVNGLPPANELVAIDGGRVRLGRPQDSPVYGWDSDYSDGSTYVDVPPFRTSKTLVSNGEFLDFVRDGGYTTRSYWDDEGWAWVTWKRPEHPWFWVPCDGGYRLRLQVHEIPLPLDWPVEVNHLEAAAYCAYRSKKTHASLRLLTEAEWLLLWDRYIGVDAHMWPRQPPGNISLACGASPCPVTAHPHGPLFDVLGNVWQHCENAVYPYEGYRVHPYYDDFSLPTFDGRHTCIKGGSWISMGNEATRDSRYAFRRHFFQFVGIRYVEATEASKEAGLCKEPCRQSCGVMDPNANAVVATSYDDDLPGGLANIYCMAGDLSMRCFTAYSDRHPERALVLSCGAGRLAFELTPHFKEVVGSDITARNLIAAFAMLERGGACYSKGERMYEPKSDDFNWGPTRSRAQFFQADPTNLHAHMNHYDLIVAIGVLENTYGPRLVPAHLLSRLHIGGVLVLGSTFHFSTATAPNVETWYMGTDVASPMEVLVESLPCGTAIRQRGVLRGLRADGDGAMKYTSYDIVVLKRTS